MVAFTIKRERLEPWIKPLHILYYDHYGQTDPFTVKWYDEPIEWTDDENKITCIDLMKMTNYYTKVHSLSTQESFRHKGITTKHSQQQTFQF